MESNQTVWAVLQTAENDILRLSNAITVAWKSQKSALPRR